MSGALGNIAGVTEYGTMGQLIANAGTVKSRLDTLTAQASSGLIASSYAGLGGGAAVSLAIAPVLAQQQTWQGNIDAATTSMQVAQTAMGQISQIAATFYADLNKLNGLDAASVDSIAANARDALTQVAGLLDSTDGTSYVFAGQDSANPPVPGPNNILTSGFYTQINAAVGALATNGAAATAAATLATAGSNAAGTSPFSTYLSQPVGTISAPTVEVGPQQRVAIGFLASANTAIASVGTSTTGSYMRDLLRGLATIGSLSSSQVSAGGFSALVADTRTSLNGAITAMSGDVGVLGDRQSALATRKTTLSDTATALTAQVSNAQDVDMAKTLSDLSQVQTQLQASYQLIAAIKSESLVNYL